MSELSCRICHRTPAANVRFHGHQGLVVLMRFSRIDGPFCRDCGLAAYRDMSATTLVRGWWGMLSVFAAAGVLVVNAVQRGKVARLPEPERARNERTLDPGKPLLDRSAAYGLLVPALLLVFVGWSVVNGG
ncbi:MULTISPECIES: hypothetical protein [Dactylosporangium]|uniref:Uncharacterized protein n=2 Tax=Dactylosporangium TaxID=35753 RepID=A0A9W6KS07_9ACTN|nr:MULTISPECIES: hypothetical protein [Dactylosporangium]UAB93075.1 hypothetical protein Dvina_32880 [Dactylosporangium vinaceum]UWZ41488.1 hypothetical protein Dmats_27925 [Dactylosporangium matsuzakiense]GLL07052.1 hypothetical protein GCM10017581_088030 [Dactylosporangium matsuzakiense]